MVTSENQEYKEYEGTQLERILRFLQKYAEGDFSESIPIPENENEFAQLLVGLNQVTDHIRELIREKDRATAMRCLAEEALRQSEERYNSFSEDLNVGAYRNTAGAKGEFIQVNPALVRMFGYDTKEELLRLMLA